jgi:hypothetical protein
VGQSKIRVENCVDGEEKLVRRIELDLLYFSLREITLEHECCIN